jgi:hypothetical protein
MELINATRMSAGYNVGLEPTGRQSLIVVIKGTFVIPKPGEQVRLHDEQSPLVMADTFTGEPGYSAPLYEMDFAPRKPMCDVLLVGSAHAPAGRQVSRMRVGLRVGLMEKSFDVVGDRAWQTGLTGVSASAPQPFARMPVSYDRAFGGVDNNGDDENERDAYCLNPVGRGWHKHIKKAWVDGTPLPNTEQIGKSVTLPTDALQPMSFGPLGRGWSNRARHAGTYDEQWLTDVFPFLPADFDERYYQAAPEDQRIPVPNGPMEVLLSGFTADGMRAIVLPHFAAPVHMFPRRGEREDLHASLDTIVFEPDQDRFTMTWRVSRPLRRDMFELAQVLVGRKGSEWWQQREERAFPIPVVMIPMPVAPRRRKQAVQA